MASPGRRRPAPSWAAATRTPRASAPPNCSAAHHKVFLNLFPLTLVV
jgi:hypothetical protein